MWVPSLLPQGSLLRSWCSSSHGGGADVAGKKGRSGRPKGRLSWTKNPTALAGHRLTALIELWLAGLLETRVSGRWLEPPTERRHTVPPKIKRVLAAAAIEDVMALHPHLTRTSIAQVLAWSRRRAPPVSLRRKVSAATDERELANRQRAQELAIPWRRR